MLFITHYYTINHGANFLKSSRSFLGPSLSIIVHCSSPIITHGCSIWLTTLLPTSYYCFLSPIDVHYRPLSPIACSIGHYSLLFPSPHHPLLLIAALSLVKAHKFTYHLSLSLFITHWCWCSLSLDKAQKVYPLHYVTHRAHYHFTQFHLLSLIATRYRSLLLNITSTLLIAQYHSSMLNITSLSFIAWCHH